MIRKELLEKGAPVTAHVGRFEGLSPMIILHKSPEAVAEDMRHTLEHRGVQFSEGLEYDPRRDGAGGRRESRRRIERDYAAKGLIQRGRLGQVKRHGLSQVPDSEDVEQGRHVHGQGVDHPQNATQGRGGRGAATSQGM